MALEPASTPAAVADGPTSLFAAATAAGKPVEAAPVTPPAETPPAEVTPTLEPTKPNTRTGLDALVGDEPPVKGKLPIEDEPEPTTKKEKVDPANYRIKELKEEISGVYAPKIKELEETLAQREARLQELEGFAAERETLKQQQAEWETEMKVVKLERTPEFVKTVTGPIEKTEPRARDLAETYGMDEGKLFKAFTEGTEKDRRAALKEATDGLDVDVDDSFEIRELIKQYLPIIEKRESLYADADKALAELAARREGETAQQAAARAEERVKAADLVASRVSAALPYLKSHVDALLPVIKSTNLDTISPEDAVYNAMAGTLLAKMNGEYKTLRAQLDEALDELASTRKTAPRVGPGGAVSNSTEVPVSLAAAAKAMMGA